MTSDEYNWKLYEAACANNREREAAKAAVNDFSDKWLVSLSAGSFGLSFAFIEKLVPLNNAVYKPLIIIAWACFIAVIVLEMIAAEIASYRLDKAIRRENEALELKYQGKEDAPVKLKTDANRLIGYIVLSLFTGGTGSLIAFVAYNIPA